MAAAGCAAVLYVVFSAVSKPEPTNGLAVYAAGDMRQLQIKADAPPMPTRTLRDGEGRETNLHAFMGDVLVVNFWATWCAPCVDEMPTLAALQRRFGDRLRVLPVSVDSEGDLDRAKRELEQLSQGALPFLNDMSRGVLFDVGASGLPMTIIYGRDGRERARLAGGADWAGEDAAALMEAALAED